MRSAASPLPKNSWEALNLSGPLKSGETCLEVGEIDAANLQMFSEKTQLVPVIRTQTKYKIRMYC